MNLYYRLAHFAAASMFGLSAALSAVLSPAAAQTASRLPAIPPNFQGEWRPDQSQCFDMTEGGLNLGARKISYYANSGPTRSILQTSPRSVTVTYIAGESEFNSSASRTVTYEVSADGNQLTETAGFGEQVRYIRCGTTLAQTAAPRPAPIDMSSIVGNWEDGGPACASIQRGRTTTSIVFRAWYCEAGEQSATPITLERLGDRVFTHRATDLNVTVHSSRMMQADAGPLSRKRFGDGLYVTDPGLFYSRTTVTAQVTAQAPVPTLMPQLQLGAYVAFPTRCAEASNATLEWWNGQFFSGGRKHPAYPRPVAQQSSGRAKAFIADTRGWEDNRVYRVNIVVLSPSMYERDGLRYFHCSEARLPATWRGSTPPQKKLSADAMLENAPEQAALTPAEFKQWQGNGSSYGYLCTVRMATGSLTMRSAPAGRPSGYIANGDMFLLKEVKLAADGETWYRAEPLKTGGTGWVSARFAACNPEHFN